MHLVCQVTDLFHTILAEKRDGIEALTHQARSISDVINFVSDQLSDTLLSTIPICNNSGDDWISCFLMVNLTLAELVAKVLAMSRISIDYIIRLTGLLLVADAVVHSPSIA